MQILLIDNFQDTLQRERLVYLHRPTMNESNDFMVKSHQHTRNRIDASSVSIAETVTVAGVVEIGVCCSSTDVKFSFDELYCSVGLSEAESLFISLEHDKTS